MRIRPIIGRRRPTIHALLLCILALPHASVGEYSGAFLRQDAVLLLSQPSRRLSSSTASYSIWFYMIVGALLLTCLVYNFFFKRRVQATMDQQRGLPDTMLRQDVIASDQEINRLWECDVCYFKSYDAHQTCMLCGTDRSFQLLETSRASLELPRRSSAISASSTTSSSEKYMMYTSETPTTKSRVRSARRSGPLKFSREFLKRKLRSLSLRQQSARRRHEWTREKNDEGQLVWVRRKRHLDRVELQRLRSHSSSSLSSIASVNSIGLVSRIVLSPTNPTGRIEIEAPEGAIATRRASDSQFPPNELEDVAKLTFQQKHAWFVQHTATLEVPWEYGHLLLEIDRDNLLHNSCEQLLWATSEQLHQSLRIKFANEPGVDAGGLVREWFTLMTKEVFDDTTGLFCTCSNGGAYTINSASSEASVDHLMYFQAIGRFIGRALFEGTLIDAHLALPLCKHILGIPITFSDLQFVDYELYKNLKWLRDNDNVESLALDFTISNEHSIDKSKVVELIPDGAQVPVTDANKQQFIDLRFQHAVATGMSTQLASFVQGVYAVVPKELLSVFDHQELELLICGIPEIDVQDWRMNTVYVGEYNDLVAAWFWKTVEGFSNEQRARLLQFTTGSARVPVQGFKALTMNDGRICPFAIQFVDTKECYYPRAHTCFNRVDLPTYETERDLRMALNLVVQMEVTGFTIE